MVKHFLKYFAQIFRLEFMKGGGMEEGCFYRTFNVNR